jgi:hypothetical protein
MIVSRETILTALTTTAVVAGYATAVAAVACSPMLQGVGLDVYDGTMSLLRAYGPELKGIIVMGWTGYSACLFGVWTWREIVALGRK